MHMAGQLVAGYSTIGLKELPGLSRNGFSDISKETDREQ